MLFLSDYYFSMLRKHAFKFTFCLDFINFGNVKLLLKERFMKRTLFALLIACSLPVAAWAQRQAVKDVVRPLPDGCIHLTNFFENDINNCVTHWNKGIMPYKGFVDFYRYGRNKFGLGEMWGKAVRSGAMFYRYNHDPELKRILQATMKDALSTVRSNGTIACVPVEKQPDSKGGDLWERKYIMLGLSQYYWHVEKDPKVLKAMVNEANSVVDQIGNAPKADITLQGWSVNGIESSSILEPMVRLYEITGKKAYLDFAKYIIEKGGCKGSDIFQEAYDNVMPRKMTRGLYPKAYEMLSIFEGLAEYYRVTGDAKARQALLNLFNNVKEREITLIGNGGGDQPYYPRWNGEAWDDMKFQQSNPKIKRMMETCVGVTWMKLCSQILRLTGDESAAEYIEKYAYNGLIGAMKPGGDGFSYVNLLNGRKVTDRGWGTTIDGLTVTCCNLNGPMGLAYIPYVEVMQTDEGPMVNLWNAAKVMAKTAKGRKVGFTIDTQFPLDGKVTLTMDDLKPELFTMKLRIPAWCGSNLKVTVNGEAVEDVKPGSYLNLKRKWTKGDRIICDFDMRCKLIRSYATPGEPAGAFVALQYGPTVLSRDENIDANYAQPVSIKADANDEVAVERVTPTLKTTRMEFIVPTADGNIHMTDYASVNGWNGKQICTWMRNKGEK